MDQFAFHLVNNLAGRNRLLDDVMIDWSKAGPLVLGLVVVAAWFRLPARPVSLQPRRLAFISIVAAVAALGLAQLISHEWFRERPYVAVPVHLLVAPSADGSFPSDHAAGGFALATPLLLDRRARRFGLAVLGGALLLAVSRVYIGTHYPGDVLAGALLGTAVALVLVALAAGLDRAWAGVWAPLRVASSVTNVARRLALRPLTTLR